MLVSAALSPPATAKLQSTCFVCGLAHPSGLRIRYDHAGDGLIQARWTPSRSWEGFQGIVHGGIVSTILDEAMSKAVMAQGYQALTAELKVRFRRPVPPGEELEIRGWVTDRFKRRIRTEAVVAGTSGAEFAHAWGVFLAFTGGSPPTGKGAALR